MKSNVRLFAKTAMNAVVFLSALLAILGPLGSPPAIAGEPWPQFRGPTSLGHTAEKNLPVEWDASENKNILWKSALVGEGHASPIIWGDRVFITTVRWDESVQDKKKVIPVHHVLCYQLSDGKKLWDTIIKPGPWVRTDFRSGPGGGYAAPTPTTDGKHIFVLFASSVMACLNYQGKIIWRKVITPHTFDVTIGASLVPYKDTIILFHAMKKKSDSKLVAYNKTDGSVKWQTPMPKTGFGHSTPIVIDVAGKKQIITLASNMGVSNEALQSFDPDTGKLLWWCKGGGDAASPAYGDGILYFDNGRGGPGFAVDPTGTGDVGKSHIKWDVKRVSSGIGSPIIVGGYVYRLHSPNTLHCWDAKTGKEIYAERLTGISTTWASPIADGNGRIYFASAGKSVVIQSGPEFKVLAVNDLADPNHASPAVAGRKMLLAGTKYLWCLGRK